MQARGNQFQFICQSIRDGWYRYQYCNLKYLFVFHDDFNVSNYTTYYILIDWESIVNILKMIIKAQWRIKQDSHHEPWEI